MNTVSFEQQIITLEAAQSEAFIRDLINNEGEVYGAVYDGNKLTDIQKKVIAHGLNGEGRDIWNQVWFEYPTTTPLQ